LNIHISNKTLILSTYAVVALLLVMMIPFKPLMGVMVIIASIILISFYIFRVKLDKLALWGILFFLPFQNMVTLDLGFFTLKISQVFLVLGLIYLFFTKKLFNKQLVVFLLAIPPILSLMNSSVISNSIKLILALVLLMLLYVVLTQLTYKIDKKTAVNSIVWSGIISALYGVYQYVGFLYFGLDTGIHYNPWDFAPKVTSFSVPNQFANYLLLPITVSLYALFTAKNRRKKIFYSASFIICLIALYLTYSSGAIISVIIGLYIMGLVMNKKIRILSLGIGYIAILAGLVYILFNQTSLNLITSDFWQARTSERTLLWSAALDMFSNHPLIGISIDNFPQYIPQYISYLSVEDHKEIHNTLLTIFTEMGLVGIVVFIGAFLYVIVKAFKAMRLTSVKENKYLIGTLLVAVIAMSIQYITDNGLYTMHFWATITLLSAYSSKFMKEIEQV
jgi:O-antigen ligase